MSKRFWGMTGLVASLVIEAPVILVPVASAATVPIIRSLTLTETSLNAQSTLITAHGKDPGGQIEYQFWVEDSHGWSMVQNYSPQNTLTLSHGSQVVTVYALDKLAFAAGDWHSAVAKTVIISNQSAVSLSSPPTGIAGNAVQFQAAAKNLVQAVYQYWVENPHGQWSASGNYNASSRWTYTPSRPGTYHVVVYAKDLMAPNNASDAVFSRQTLTVAPSVPHGYKLHLKLANPDPNLDNSNALLLGHTAQVEAIVQNANGQPVADVPVFFTATNDSNPSDHVSFAQGLNDKAYTNQNGVALADLYVTNPSDSSPSQLAQDASAVSLVGYSVSLPQDPSADPLSSTVAYAAYIPPNLDITTANRFPGLKEAIYRNTLVQQTAYLPWLSSGNAAAFHVSGQYIVPTSPHHGVLTIPVNYHSGAYGPDVTESSSQELPVIPITSGFGAASIELTHLGLSSGSSFTVNFTQMSDSTPTWSKTITGPVSFKDRTLQIPTSSTGGQLTFRLQAGPVVDPSTATGISIGSVVVDAGQNPGTQILPAPLPVSWSSVPVTYGAWQDLSPQEAAQYLGSNVPSSSAVIYRYKVPAFPELGNAVLEEITNNQPQAYYWIPTTNNGANQNVLANPSTQGSGAVLISPESLTSLMFSTRSTEKTWTLSSQRAGQAEIVAQVSPGKYPRPSDKLYSYVGWIPGTPENHFASQYALSGQQVIMTALVKDGAGNPVPGAPVNWSVSKGVNVVQQSATTNSQGVATMILSVGDAATAMVEATSPGESVSLTDLPDQAPFAAAKIHFVTWHWLNMGRLALSLKVGSTHDVGVMAQGVSASGHLLRLTNAAFTISQVGVGEASQISRANPQVGVIRVTSDRAGTQNIQISPASLEPDLEIGGNPDVGEGPISGIAPTKISVNFTANAGTMSLMVPSSVSAVGTDVPIDVRVADIFGNPVANQPISFSLWTSSGGSARLSSTKSVTNAQGIAQVFLSGGSVGEVDEVGASLAEHDPQSAIVRWQNSTGPEMALVNAQIDGTQMPNTLSLTMSRQLNPKTLLPNGSQFQLEDVSTHTMYQVEHATLSGRTVTLTLASSNPVLNFNDQMYRVSVKPVTNDGVTFQVMDSQNQAAQNAVTVDTPSSPSIAASLSSGKLTIVLGNGKQDIAPGMSVSVVANNGQASINNGGAGAVYQTTTGSTTSTETITVPVSGPVGTIYTTYFDGISRTCS